VKCGKIREKQGLLCHDCQRVQHYFSKGRSFLVYDGFSKKSLLGLKFFGKTWVGKRYGRLLAEFYIKEKLWDFDYIIPVPLHYTRFLRRGYNQAEIIATSFLREVKKHEEEWVINEQKKQKTMLRKVLMRRKHTKPQKTLSDIERYNNMMEAFYIRNKFLIRDKVILLLDDIYTTGATVDGCARILLDNGARDVFVLTVAIGKGI